MPSTNRRNSPSRPRTRTKQRRHLPCPSIWPVRTGRLSLADLSRLGYVRPAGIGEVTIDRSAANGGKALSEPFRLRSVRPRDPLTYVVLSLGAARPDSNCRNRRASLRMSRRASAADELYWPRSPNSLSSPISGSVTSAADLVVLHTDRSATGFLKALFGDVASRAARTKRTALVEWVQRGGRLVVSVGENALDRRDMPGASGTAPVRREWRSRTRQARDLLGARESSQTSMFSGALAAKQGQFRIANLVAEDRSPGAGADPSARPAQREG